MTLAISALAREGALIEIEAVAAPPAPRDEAIPARAVYLEVAAGLSR